MQICYASLGFPKCKVRIHEYSLIFRCMARQQHALPIAAATTPYQRVLTLVVRNLGGGGALRGRQRGRRGGVGAVRVISRFYCHTISACHFRGKFTYSCSLLCEETVQTDIILCKIG